MRIDNEKKSDRVRVENEEKSDGVRVDYEKNDRWGES